MENLKIDPSTLDSLRVTSPLVHHLTNQVTMNDCANITLAIGASPAMTEGLADSLDLVEFAGALVINMGTPTEESVEVMVQVGKKAKSRGIPVVFDPVAAGATASRREASLRILREVRPTIVKGNGAEIKFLAGEESQQRGVDSLENHGIAHAARRLAAQYGLVVVATGVVDIVSDGKMTLEVRGGHSYMSRITGTGCMSASVQGSFAAVEKSPFNAALLGVLAMNLAGERAHGALLAGEGTGHYRTRLIDAVSLLASGDLRVEGRVKHADL